MAAITINNGTITATSPEGLKATMPISRLADCINQTAADLKDSPLVAPLVAHAVLNACSFLQMGLERHLPGLAPGVVIGLSLVSIGLLVAGRRQVRAGVVLAVRLARSLVHPPRATLALGALGLASGLGWVALLGLGLLAGNPTAAERGLVNLFPVLWAVAGVLHHFRRLPLFRDAPRADAADPGRPAGVTSGRETGSQMVG